MPTAVKLERIDRDHAVLRPGQLLSEIVRHDEKCAALLRHAGLIRHPIDLDRVGRKFEALLQRDPGRSVGPEDEVALRPVSHGHAEDEFLRLALDESLDERAGLLALLFAADQRPLAEVAGDRHLGRFSRLSLGFGGRGRFRH
jgi:hypothetical protein